MADWNNVKKIILKHLSETKNNILVFEPESSKKSGRDAVLSMYCMKYKNLQDENYFIAINANAKPMKPVDGERILEITL
ncbi:hypothetical protein ACIPSX_08370 [Pectobacterium sp. CHL-2024]|uniref:hypothetical protein n=1 Tax=Pectobacterium TaxID=122277 RepID=UPI002A7EB974|nr:hypothetical protein [Pectobacterium brasiliense]MDY4324204.1 hypothetical protein [Pectobacterium brasiliense]